jgi:ribose/xylose/arabinose/galactoside ABC-type transport system permease subunit
MRARDLVNRLGPLLGLLGVLAFFTAAVWLKNGWNSYLTANNLQTIAIQSAIVGMAALGMTMVILSGGIDLSVGSIVALTSVVVAALLAHGGWAALPAAAGGVAAGAGCGLVNGVLVTRLRVVPFIVTLGTYLVFRGAAKLLADDRTINPGPSALNSLLDQSGVLPWGVWMVLLLGAGVAAFLRYTRPGRHLTAIGSNEQAARLCGVPVLRLKGLVYVLGGAFGGLAGLLQFSRLTIGDPTSAPGLELDVIAAVVIGGASLAGGEGSVAGSLVGALIMTAIRSGCSQMGWRNSITEIVAGAIIVAAVALDRLRHRRA